MAVVPIEGIDFVICRCPERHPRGPCSALWRRMVVANPGIVEIGAVQRVDRLVVRRGADMVRVAIGLVDDGGQRIDPAVDVFLRPHLACAGREWLIAFLCGANAGYITGQNIVNDGGVYQGIF